MTIDFAAHFEHHRPTTVPTESRIVTSSVPTRLADEDRIAGYLITNPGPEVIYVGGSDLNVHTGHPVPPGESFERLSVGSPPWLITAPDTEPQTVNVKVARFGNQA